MTYLEYDTFHIDYPINSIDQQFSANNVRVGDSLWQATKQFSLFKIYTVLKNTYRFDKSQLKTVLQWFMSYKGSYSPFWIRSYKWDFQIYAGAVAGASAIQVKKTYPYEFYYNRNLHIYIPELDSEHEITGYDLDYSDYDILTISPVLSDSIGTDTRIERLLFVRIASDVLTVQPETFELYKIFLSFKEIIEETPGA